jgi:hypothetical protein
MPGAMMMPATLIPEITQIAQIQITSVNNTRELALAVRLAPEIIDYDTSG